MTRASRINRIPTTLLLSLSVAALAFGAGCPGNMEPLAQFGSSGAGQSFSTWDVHERAIAVGVPSENVTVLFFNGKATSDAMQPITADIAIHFVEARDIDFVNVVDLRTLEFYERPFAAGAIRDAGGRTIGRVNRRLRNEGLPELPNLHDHLYLIADAEGAITEQFRVRDPDRFITCIVYDKQGRELGRWDPQAELEAVIAAIEVARNTSPPEE